MDMKKSFAFLAVFSGAVMAWGQLPSRNTSLTLDAKSVSTGGATSSSHSGGSVGLTSNGVQLPFSAPTSSSSDKHESKIRLHVETRNLGTAPAGARLEWYFVARRLNAGPHSEYIWDIGRRDVSVTPGGTDKEELESSALLQTTTRGSTAPTANYMNGQLYTSTGSGYTSREGSIPIGWIVRLMDGDQMLRVQASSSTLEAAARDQERLKKLFEWSPDEVHIKRSQLLKPTGPGGK